jgi:general secretion pathway protein D
MGGLTRDEVKTVNDKVPVLGDIPFLGRLFQSKGESSEKRNLMIFVTANLISPGGAPASQSFQNLQRGAIFSNPTLLLPAGPFQRTPPAAQSAGATSDK